MAIGDETTVQQQSEKVNNIEIVFRLSIETYNLAKC